MMGATVVRATGCNCCIVNPRPMHLERFVARSPAALFTLHYPSSRRRHSSGFFQRTRAGIALQHSVSFTSWASSHSPSFMMNCGMGSLKSTSISGSHGKQLTRVGAVLDPRSFSQLGKLDWREAHGTVKIRGPRKKGPRVACCSSQAGGDQPSSSSVLPPLHPIAKAKGSRINFCSRCGGTTEEKIPSGEHEVRFVCSVCGSVHYQNPKMVVGCLVEHEDQVLLCRRNIEPSYGLWTLPGGYMEIGESAAEGAARETREEACADVQVLGLFALLDAPLIGESYIIFRARLKNPHFTPGPESLECALFKLNDIPFNSLAFSPILVTLKWYLEDIKAGQLRVHHAVIDKRPGSIPSDPHGFTVRDVLCS